VFGRRAERLLLVAVPVLALGLPAVFEHENEADDEHSAGFLNQALRGNYAWQALAATVPCFSLRWFRRLTVVETCVTYAT
jgi:hypothetical protein